MLARLLTTATVYVPFIAFAAPSSEPADESELAEITVSERRVANSAPAGTYATLATTLRFDPLTELQSRGLAEGQSDVTVRGGLFENTGFKLGAVTVMDPQTGHYFAELPVDPASVASPVIVKGIENAVQGFNSNIATVSYAPVRLDDGGSVLLGAGSDDLNFQSLRFARTRTAGDGSTLGAALSASWSAGDGSLPNGDHDFARYNLHLQRGNAQSQSDVILAYQDKFYGWPGAYTGFATLAETDDTQTSLLFANHRRDTDRGWWEVGGYYRALEDDYDFDRTTSESGAPGSFDHKTRVYAVGFQGLYRSGDIDWRYGGQVTVDELVESTDLTNGDFDDRSYATLTVVPSMDFDLAGDRRMTLRIGATVDTSSRDSNAVLPLLGVSVAQTTARGTTNVAIEYVETSQVPGYTVLASRPAGLFGGNASLGRERSKQLTASLSRSTTDWQGSVAVFARRDDDLVDWTFASGAPFARQANPVDIDVIGVEALITRQWSSLDIAAGYTYLNKDEDYGSATVDASFYALNFARHRATLALRYRFAERFELRLDNEYRVQQKNPLRTSTDETYLGSLSVVWSAPGNRGLGVALTVDNLGDSDYEPFPGTPAVGRQLSLSASYRW